MREEKSENKNMKNTKSLLEIAKDLEVLASDMKKSNEDFFKNMFYLAGDIRDKSREFSGLATEEKEIDEELEAANKELEVAYDDEMRREENEI